MDRWRLAGLPIAASVLLIAGGVKLWQAQAGPAAAGALFGCGLLLLGVAIRDWLEHHTHDEEQTDARTHRDRP